MSSMVPSGYKFGVTYVGNKQISPQEVCFFKKIILTHCELYIYMKLRRFQSY
jgi:hypothetical protein